MRSDSVGKICSFGQVPNGSVFLCKVRNSNRLCVKAFVRVGTDEVPMILALAHPEAGGLPGLWNSGVLTTDTVLDIGDAFLRLPAEPDDVTLGSYGKVAGQIVGTGDDFLLLVIDGDGLASVNMNTGEINGQASSGPRMGFSCWSIERLVGDDRHVLFEFPPQRSTVQT